MANCIRWLSQRKGGVVTEKRRGFHREKEAGGTEGRRVFTEKRRVITEKRRGISQRKGGGGHRGKKVGNQLPFGVWRGCALVAARTKSTRETVR